MTKRTTQEKRFEALMILDAREARLEQRYIVTMRSNAYACEQARAMQIAALNREANDIARERRAIDAEAGNY